MPSTDPSPDDYPPVDPESFGSRLRRNWERATRNLPPALVPLASALLAVAGDSRDEGEVA